MKLLTEIGRKQVNILVEVQTKTRMRRLKPSLVPFYLPAMFIIYLPFGIQTPLTTPQKNENLIVVMMMMD